MGPLHITDGKKYCYYCTLYFHPVLTSASENTFTALRCISLNQKNISKYRALSICTLYLILIRILLTRSHSELFLYQQVNDNNISLSSVKFSDYSVG